MDAPRPTTIRWKEEMAFTPASSSSTFPSDAHAGAAANFNVLVSCLYAPGPDLRVKLPSRCLLVLCRSLVTRLVWSPDKMGLVDLRMLKGRAMLTKRYLYEMVMDEPSSTESSGLPWLSKGRSGCGPDAVVAGEKWSWPGGSHGH